MIRPFARDPFHRARSTGRPTPAKSAIPERFPRGRAPRFDRRRPLPAVVPDVQRRRGITFRARPGKLGGAAADVDVENELPGSEDRARPRAVRRAEASLPLVAGARAHEFARCWRAARRWLAAFSRRSASGEDHHAASMSSGCGRPGERAVHDRASAASVDHPSLLYGVSATGDWNRARATRRSSGRQLLAMRRRPMPRSAFRRADVDTTPQRDVVLDPSASRSRPLVEENDVLVVGPCRRRGRGRALA